MKQKDKFSIIQEVGYLQGIILGMMYNDNIPKGLKDKLAEVYDTSLDRVDEILRGCNE